MIIEASSETYKEKRIPGMVATTAGTLLRYCECRRAQSDWAAIDIKISRSADAGETWDTVLLIEGNGNTLNNPVMFVCEEKLVFLYCKNYKEIWKRVSVDDGKTFSPSVRVDFEGSVDFFYNVVAVGPGHGICHGGRLIVPVWFAYNEQNEKAHQPSLISTLYSEDDGATWQIGEIIGKDVLKNPSECALAITGTGELLISIRHEGAERTRALAKSADGISGWYGLTFEESLPDPICMGSMTQRGEWIYHANCASVAGRTALTVKVSDDCFESYKAYHVSDIGGYSDIALLGNRLFVLYEKTVCNDEGRWEPICLYLDAIELS